MKGLIRIGLMIGVLAIGLIYTENAHAQRRQQCDVQQSSVSSAAVLQSAEIARLQAQLSAFQQVQPAATATAVASSPRPVQAPKVAVQAPLAAPLAAAPTATAIATGGSSRVSAKSNQTVRRTPLRTLLAPKGRTVTTSTATTRTVTRG